MHRVRRPALVLAVLSALLPTLFLALVLVPSFVPLGLVPGVGLAYGLLGGWLLCALARGIVSRRFTPLERSVVGFWAHTLLFILVFATVLGTLPLLVLPALGASFGWPIVTTDAYARTTTLALLILSGFIVWSLWRKHWTSLLASSEAQERAA
jgi:hypothetical protein